MIQGGCDVPLSGLEEMDAAVTAKYRSSRWKAATCQRTSRMDIRTPERPPPSRVGSTSESRCTLATGIPSAKGALCPTDPMALS